MSIRTFVTTQRSGGGKTVVVLEDDGNTFSTYVVVRPPNVDRIVAQHIEDRPLEAAVRGVYYIAPYRHQPDDGETFAVVLDRYCGRADPDAETNDEAAATARRIDEVDERATAAVAQAGERSTEARSNTAGRSFDGSHVSVWPNRSVGRGGEPHPPG